jgi:phosphate acetyltransferase
MEIAPLHGERTPDRLYLFSPEGGAGRDTVAVGLLKSLSTKFNSPSVFRPTSAHGEHTTDLFLAAARSFEKTTGANDDRTAHVGVKPSEIRENTADARLDIVTRFYESSDLKNADYTLIVGSDYTPIAYPGKMLNNSLIAADLQACVVITVEGTGRSAYELAETIKASVSAVEAKGAPVVGVFVSPCTEELKAAVSEELKATCDLPVWYVPAIEDAAEEDPEALLAQHVAAYETAVSDADVVAALSKPVTTVVTPACFQYSLLAMAKSDKKKIVLPEGDDDRILQAADYLLSRDVADVVIVGEKADILAQSEKLGLGAIEGKATFQSMKDPAVLTPMIEELVKLRGHKGMTPEKAAATLEDPSYFGTMLIQLGLADGMVSGAKHSTANTVRPALQIIKTNPDDHLVSGAFLMCMDDRVDVYADCAINLNPSSAQLAEIAHQSARTAQAFGIDPVVGMLTYSTLGSGSGPDVDLVTEGEKLAEENYPDLKVVGPIQFDAAWSPTVAAKKANGNPYAGRVNTFIFPSLSAGNIGYKAVQRTSNAVAIGPVLQGLRKPVNDLSRGALTRDIINTIALTAISAQN